MTTFLYNILTAGADKMAQTDPSGWILTGISVSVVFSALVILYFIYNLSGNIFSGKYKKSPKKASSNDEVAAAIALALQAEMSSDTEVAIAMALHLHLSNAVHDIEPGVITIKKNPSSEWNNKQRNFRK